MGTSTAIGVGLPLPAPLPPPASPASAGAPEKKKKGPGDMDWDDEDASTQLFAGQTGEAPAPTGPRPAAGAPLPGAAAALLAGSGGLAAAGKHGSSPPGPLTSTLPAAQPVPVSVPAMPPAAPPPPDASYRAAPDASSGRGSGGSKAGVILGGLSLVVVLALAVFIFLPKKGQLKIDIKANSGAPIAKAEIYIDGQKKCDTSPCIITDLDPGPKSIKIIAPDFMTPPLTETVEAGKEKVVLIPVDLAGAAGVASPVGATPAGPTVTALKIGGAQPGVKVFVDGVEKGTLPLELKDITPGSHKIRLEGGERYDKLEQTVDVVSGQVKDLGALKLKVLKGQITLELGTDDASVMLVRTDGKKIEKKLPASIWKSPPVKIEINPSETWKIVATKKGFDEFTQEISFEDGNAEKTIRIALNETGKTPAATAAATPAPEKTSSGGGTTTPPDKGTTTTPPPDKTSSTTTPPDKGATGTGTLNINSIPVSKVVLDGRPLGSTPKIGVSVPAGTHTVTFIHPEKGKKSVSVTVKAGETKTAAMKF